MTNDNHLPEATWATPGTYLRLVAAGHIDDSCLSERGRRVLRWLSESDGETIGGLEEILRLVHEGGACRHGFSNPTWCAICTPSEGRPDISRR
jgi:hypothetical protein